MKLEVLLYFRIIAVIHWIPYGRWLCIPFGIKGVGDGYNAYQQRTDVCRTNHWFQNIFTNLLECDDCKKA